SPSGHTITHTVALPSLTNPSTVEGDVTSDSGAGFKIRIGTGAGAPATRIGWKYGFAGSGADGAACTSTTFVGAGAIDTGAKDCRSDRLRPMENAISWAPDK